MNSDREYDMGYRADEFADVLRGPFMTKSADFSQQSVKPNHWQIKHNQSDFFIDIQIDQQPDRILGLFRLPVLKVQFQMQNDSGKVTEQFFKRFHQYFHKGGG